MKTKSIKKNLREYEILKKINIILYFLSHAPILKHFFHSDLVGEYTSKEGMLLTYNTVNFLWTLFKKLLYLDLAICMRPDKPILTCFFFIVMTLIGTFIRKINKFDMKDYDAVKLLRIAPNEYGKIKIDNYVKREFINMSLAMLYVRTLLNLNYFILFYLVIVYLAIHIIGEKKHITNIEKNSFKDKENNFINIIYSVLILALFVIIVRFRTEIPTALLSLLTKVFIPFSLIVSIIIVIYGYLAYRYLRNYCKYEKLYRNNLRLDKIMKSQLKYRKSTDAYILEKMNKSIDIKEVEIKKKGYEYLHSLFEKRYKISKNSGRYISLGIIILFCFLIVFLPKIIGIFISKGILKETDAIKNYANFIFSNLFYILFFNYSIGMATKTLIKQYFFQIDRYLIHYNFYRSEDSIKKNIIMRYKTVLKLNLPSIILLTLSLGIVMIVYSNPFSLIKLLAAISFPISCFVFFSFYQIACYYLFQPYSFDGNMVNKLYGVVDGVIYFIIYMCMTKEVKFNLPIVTTLSLTFIIMGTALFIIVIKKAPKLFRVR